MELKEMIKVMQHYENGGEVECVDKGNDNWEIVTKPLWNFDDFEYRIKEQKQKVTIEKWLLKDDEDNYYVVQTSNIDIFNDDTKIKLIESYEVEL
jgi:hypothetical protein